jgi:hypothetical protein
VIILVISELIRNNTNIHMHFINTQTHLPTKSAPEKGQTVRVGRRWILFSNEDLINDNIVIKGTFDDGDGV